MKTSVVEPHHVDAAPDPAIGERQNYAAPTPFLWLIW
jgi:hypothetical protein